MGCIDHDEFASILAKKYRCKLSKPNKDRFKKYIPYVQESIEYSVQFYSPLILESQPPFLLLSKVLNDLIKDAENKQKEGVETEENAPKAEDKNIPATDTNSNQSTPKKKRNKKKSKNKKDVPQQTQCNNNELPEHPNANSSDCAEYLKSSDTGNHLIPCGTQLPQDTVP